MWKSRRIRDDINWRRRRKTYSLMTFYHPDDPTLADGDANSSPPPTVLPAEKDEKGEEEKEEEEEEKDPECKDLLPPFAPISQLLKSVAEVDVSLTQSMAMAATPSSPLGCIRPALRLLEFSCHGVPWLILAVTLLMIGEAMPDQPLGPGPGPRA